MGEEIGRVLYVVRTWVPGDRLEEWDEWHTHVHVPGVVAQPQVLALLQSAGFSVVDGHPDLPWIAIRDDDGAGVRRLEQRGIRPLLPTTARVFPTAFRTKGAGVFRLTIPLSDERLSSMRGLLELRRIRVEAC